MSPLIGHLRFAPVFFDLPAAVRLGACWPTPTRAAARAPDLASLVFPRLPLPAGRRGTGDLLAVSADRVAPPLSFPSRRAGRRVAVSCLARTVERGSRST